MQVVQTPQQASEIADAVIPTGAGDGGCPDNAAEGTATLRLATLATLLLLCASAVGAQLIFPSLRYPGNLLYLTQYCAMRQDIPVGFGLAGLFVLTGLLRRQSPSPAARLPGLTMPRALVVVAATVLVTWAIRTMVLFDHDFTRDEQMASFCHFGPFLRGKVHRNDASAAPGDTQVANARMKRDAFAAQDVRDGG